MGRLQTMSEPERQSWVTFIADALVFAWFVKVMLANWTSVPDAKTPAELGEIYLYLIIITVIYHVIISVVFKIRRRRDGVESDERDTLIQGEGSTAGYKALEFSVGMIIIIGLFCYIAGENYIPPMRIDTPVQFIFALTAVSYVASLIKHGVILLRYGAP